MVEYCDKTKNMWCGNLEGLIVGGSRSPLEIVCGEIALPGIDIWWCFFFCFIIDDDTSIYIFNRFYGWGCPIAMIVRSHAINEERKKKGWGCPRVVKLKPPVRYPPEYG